MWLSKSVISFCLFLALSFSIRVVESRNLLELDCDCGLKNHDATTILSRGTYSENHAWPWMVSIVNVSILEDPVAYCGATLINDRYILTAAHCIPDMMDTGIENFRLYLGSNYILNASMFVNLGIGKVISHPKFDYETADFDVCLIKLDEPVTVNNFIRPVCLKQHGSPFVGTLTYMTGWGSFNLTEHTEDALKEAEAIVVSNEICAQNYSSVEIPVTDNMICVHMSPPEDDPCKGDSGGPLMVKDGHREVYSQIGIVSHGEGCTVLDFPPIFSRVESFISWIKENTKDGYYCRGTFSS